MSLEREETGNIKSLAGTGDKQLWIIQPLVFNLNVYYDQAFCDLTEELEMTPKTYINNVMLTNTTGDDEYRNIPQAFLDYFGIHLKYNLINSAYESYPYQHNCAEKDDPWNICHYCNKPAGYIESLVQDCTNGNHHKQCNFIRKSTPQQPKKIAGSLLFSGHNTCSVSNNIHVDGDSNSGGGWDSNADVFPIKMNNIEDYDCIKRVVYHELLHMFTVTHHYDSGEAYCAHGDERFDVTVEIPLLTCSRCIAIVDDIKISELFNY